MERGIVCQELKTTGWSDLVSPNNGETQNSSSRWIVDVRRDWVWWEVGGEENFKKR